MSGYQNNGPKIPELGGGILRPPKEPKEKSPQFTGLVNFNGQIISLSIWYMAPSMNNRGQQMPASFSAKVQPYDPNRGAAPQGQGYPPQQQAMQYGAPPQQQYAPQPVQAPQYAPPQQHPQQATGYQPAPSYAPQPAPQQAPQQAPQGYPPQGGYVPTPSAAPQQAPASGGYAQGYGQQGSTFTRDEIPFAAAK